MAQELYLLGRFAEARQLIERAIELAAAPGHDVRPEGLARYYYYLGRIIEASGDLRGATSQYRRAAEYDPGYAPPVLALAKRSADAGDQRHAETLLINAAHAAMESGGAVAAVPLQRGLARILLASGDRPAAIEAYRGILAVEPDGAGDRVALAEIYAVDDLPKAISELKKVIDRDIRHAPAYRLLASFYARIGEQDRASRVLATMELLGFAEESDRAAAAKARATLVHQPLRRQLDDDMRSQMLVTVAAAGAIGQLYNSIAAEVTGLFPQPAMGENLVPVQTVDDAAFKVALADMCRLYGIEPEVYVGEHVPGGTIALAFPRRILVVDREYLAEADAARRFLLGYMFDGIRGGYSLIYALGRRQRTELAALLRSLLLPEADRPGPTNEFVRALPKRAAKIIEGLAGKRRELDPEDWIEEMLATSKRAGLFASDDFPSATRMIARLAGENVGDGSASTALGAVLGGADLVRFYLSDEYHRLRELLSNPLPVAAA
jgi:tetratricopeptide (TPR) repeat protein